MENVRLKFGTTEAATTFKGIFNSVKQGAEFGGTLHGYRHSDRHLKNQEIMESERDRDKKPKFCRVSRL